MQLPCIHSRLTEPKSCVDTRFPDIVQSMYKHTKKFQSPFPHFVCHLKVKSIFKSTAPHLWRSRYAVLRFAARWLYLTLVGGSCTRRPADHLAAEMSLWRLHPQIALYSRNIAEALVGLVISIEFSCKFRCAWGRPESIRKEWRVTASFCRLRNDRSEFQPARKVLEVWMLDIWWRFIMQLMNEHSVCSFARGTGIPLSTGGIQNFAESMRNAYGRSCQPQTAKWNCGPDWPTMRLRRSRNIHEDRQRVPWSAQNFETHQTHTRHPLLIKIHSHPRNLSKEADGADSSRRHPWPNEFPTRRHLSAHLTIKSFNRIA